MEPVFGSGFVIGWGLPRSLLDAGAVGLNCARDCLGADVQPLQEIVDIQEAACFGVQLFDLGLHGFIA